jgi:uncharacterized protein (TIGR01370 family)
MPAEAEMKTTLSEVQSFLYLITNSLEENGLAQEIADSPYDLILASYNPADANIASVVAAANPDGDKILLGYFDVAEASSFGNPGLFTGGPHPSWFGAVNPGWAGIYSVEYWAPEWKAEVFARIDQMIAAGFDGIYLDVCSGDAEWLPGNSFGNPATPDATAKLVTLISEIREYVDSKNLAHPFYLIPNAPTGIAQSDPSALKLFDAIFNESVYYYTQNTASGGDTSTIFKLPGDPAWTLANAPAYDSAGIPVFGNDYTTPSDAADDLRSFAFYSALGWVPSVQGPNSSRDVLATGPFMATATAAAPVVQGAQGQVNFLSGGSIDGAQLTGGPEGDYFIGGPGRNTIAGAAGDDIIYAHPANAVLDHVLDIRVNMAAVNPSHPAGLQIIINGQVAVVDAPVTGTPDSQADIRVDTTAYGTIDSIQLIGKDTYYNNANDYNNIFVRSLSLDGETIALAQGQYNELAEYLTYPGGDNAFLNTGGTITFSGSAIPASPFLADTSDDIDGGSGSNTVVYRGNYSQYALTPLGDGGFSVRGLATAEGTDSLHDIQALQFADATLHVDVSFDISGIPGQAYRLYQAAFDRIPDMGGLGYQIHDIETRFGLVQVAANFIASPEFQSTYGNVNDTQFITLLYQNVLHRAPDEGGLQYHLGEIAGGQSRADVLTHFSESPENQANVAGAITDGIVYIVYP